MVERTSLNRSPSLSLSSPILSNEPTLTFMCWWFTTSFRCTSGGGRSDPTAGSGKEEGAVSYVSNLSARLERWYGSVERSTTNSGVKNPLTINC